MQNDWIKDMKMTRNMIITGNGFDLSMGLKTSYKDFIECQLENNKTIINNLVNNLDELVLFQENSEYIGRLISIHTDKYSQNLNKLINIYKMDVNWTNFYNFVKNDDFTLFEITDYKKYSVTHHERGIKVNDKLVQNFPLLFKQVINNDYYSFTDDFLVLTQNKLGYITDYQTIDYPIDINKFNEYKKVLLELCEFFAKIDKIKKYIDDIKKEEYLIQYFIWEFKFNNEDIDNNWSDIEKFISNIIIEKSTPTAKKYNHLWLFNLIMLFKTTAFNTIINYDLLWFLKFWKMIYSTN